MDERSLLLSLNRTLTPSVYRCGRCERLDLGCKPSEPFKTSNIGSGPDGTVTDLDCNSGSKHIRAACMTESCADEASDSEITEMFNDDEIAAADMNSDDALEGGGGCPFTDVSTATTMKWPATMTERYLMHHYTNRVSAVLVNVDSPSNPLRSVLLPRALASPTLMDALYATSAMHAFMGNRKAEFRRLSLAFYNRAITALRQAIANLDAQHDPAAIETLLLTSIYLCKWEIISDGTHWRAHFQGIRRLWETDKVQNSLAEMDSEAVAFIRSL